MSNKVTLTGNGQYIYVELLGDMPIEKLYAANSFLYSDREFIDHPYAIWDFTGCTIDLEMDKVMTFATRVMKDRHFDTPGKTAFISSDEHVLSMSVSMASMMNETMPFQIQGFHDRVSAVKWINEKDDDIDLIQL